MQRPAKLIKGSSETVAYMTYLRSLRKRRVSKTPKRTTRKSSPPKRKSSPKRSPKTPKRVARKGPLNCAKVTMKNASPSIVKKYIERKSPSYPANKCPAGMKKKGSDGHMYYVSQPSKKGVKRWIKVVRKAKTPKRKYSKRSSKKM